MRVLVSDIIGGSLRPGTLLPSELEIVEQFGISRGVARECIRGLEERGLISVKHGMGATVLPPESWDIFDPEVVAAQLATGQGAQMLGEFLECRRVLEVAGAGLAAQRATAKDLTNLNATFEKMTVTAHRVLSNPAAEDLYHEADIAFHQAVITASHNRALARMAAPLHGSLLARRALARPDLRVKRNLPEHKRILDAITARDVAKARSAMEAHLLTVESYLREYTGQADGHPVLDLPGLRAVDEPTRRGRGARRRDAASSPDGNRRRSREKLGAKVAASQRPRRQLSAG